jgi:hypothetical protein
VDRIADPVIAPTVPARAGDVDIEPAAGQRLARDVIGGRTIQHQQRGKPAAQRRLAAQITHAAQVSLALFANIGDEYQAPKHSRTADLYRLRHCQQCRQTSAIVRYPRPMEFAVWLQSDFFLGILRRHHGVQMRGHRDHRPIVIAGRGRHHIAGAVDTCLVAKIAKLRLHPLGARLFEESGSGNAAELQMTVIDPLLRASEPFKALT